MTILSPLEELAGIRQDGKLHEYGAIAAKLEQRGWAACISMNYVYSHIKIINGNFWVNYFLSAGITGYTSWNCHYWNARPPINVPK